MEDAGHGAERTMTGVSVLYAREAARERDWPGIPERDRTGRLREVYWMRRAESKSRRSGFVNATLHWRPDRRELGRTAYDPGDGFVYLLETTPSMADRFEWLEVTEAFTTVPAREIERAMRAWNGIRDRDPVDFAEFRGSLRLVRPTRAEQRRAADEVIGRIEKKLAKKSYRELVGKYGYGTLVVGLPLWFATPPNDPFRAENAVDDFATRTILGLEEIRKRLLGRPDCPFGKVIVLWDTSPQAVRGWRAVRSAAYEDAAMGPKDSLGIRLWTAFADFLDEALLASATPESEAPSMNMHLSVAVRKKAPAAGPYPELVEAIRRFVRDGDRKGSGVGSELKLRAVPGLRRLLRRVRAHGVKGLGRWISHRFSVARVWRVKATQRRARRFYRESRRRTRGARDGRRGIRGGRVERRRWRATFGTPDGGARGGRWTE